MKIKDWLFRKKKQREKLEVIWLEETNSTNDEIRKSTSSSSRRMSVVVADYQRSGRGQATNQWESEAGKNLLFSIMIHPLMVPVRNQFLLSMAGGLALKEVLDSYTPEITLKWPNDVYWRDRKISGTLIETTLSAGHIKDCIFGIGLNVNQQVFKSDAPNPVSLAQILGHEIDRKKLLDELLSAFDKYYSWIENGQYGDISTLYHEALYHRQGFYPYRDVASGEVFEAAIIEVEDDGTLVVRNREGIISEYRFKELESLKTSTAPSERGKCSLDAKEKQ